MNGLLAAYFLRWALRKIRLEHLLDRQMQAKITGFTTDYVVVASFMAVQAAVVAAWLVPILVTVVLVTAAAVALCFAIGQRYGSDRDFERKMGTAEAADRALQRRCRGRAVGEHRRTRGHRAPRTAGETPRDEPRVNGARRPAGADGPAGDDRVDLLLPHLVLGRRAPAELRPGTRATRLLRPLRAGSRRAGDPPPGHARHSAGHAADDLGRR